MKSDVIVHYEKEDATFAAGDVVKGHVQVMLTSEVKVKGQVHSDRQYIPNNSESI